jgi:hypothetical protein
MVLGAMAGKVSMRSLVKTFSVGAITLGSSVGLSVIGGCEEHHGYHEHAVVVPQSRTVYYEPGYYYDREYRDHDGRWHDRQIYYWDGHRWDHRDRVPSGYTLRERQRDAHDDHRDHVEHREHVERTY